MRTASRRDGRGAQAAEGTPGSRHWAMRSKASVSRARSKWPRGRCGVSRRRSRASTDAVQRDAPATDADAAEGATKRRRRAQWMKDHPEGHHGARVSSPSKAWPRTITRALSPHYATRSRSIPNNVVMLNNLAWVLARDRRSEGASSTRERAYRSAPDHPGSHRYLGLGLVQNGDATKGIELLRGRSNLAPSDAGEAAAPREGTDQDRRQERRRRKELGDRFQADVAAGARRSREAAEGL